MKTIELDFDYYTSKEKLPNYKGVYIVYRAIPYKDGKGASRAIIKEIIYIGKAEDETINERHVNHEKQPLFDATLCEGEELRYSTVKVSVEDIDRVENGLIFKRKPRLNDDLKDYFHHPDTHFVLTGKIKDITTDFTIEKTE